jgi:hypothetical protein
MRSNRPVESGEIINHVENTRVSQMGIFEHDAMTGDAISRRYEELIRQAISLENKLPLSEGYKENFEAAIGNYRAARVNTLNILNQPGGNDVEYIRSRSSFQQDVTILRESMSNFADEFERQLKAATTFKGMCPDKPDIEKSVSKFIIKEIPDLLDTMLDSIAAAGNQLAVAAASSRKILTGTDGDLFRSNDDISSMQSRLKIVREELEDIQAKSIIQTRGNNQNQNNQILEVSRRKLDREEKELIRGISVTEEKNKKASRSVSSIPNQILYDQAITTIKAAAQAYAKEIIAKAEVLKSKLVCASADNESDVYSDFLDALMNRYTEKVYLRLLSSAIGRTLSDDAAVLAAAGDIAISSQAALSHTYSLVNSHFATIRKGIYETHASVIETVGSPSSHIDALRSKDTGVLYLFKLARIGTAAAAAFVATKTFENHYVYAMSRSGGVWETFSGGGNPKISKPAPPDLKWFAASFLMFETIFNTMLFTAAWFILKLAVDEGAESIFYDLVFDTVIGMALTASSVVWLCDIIQDKRYFEYRVAVPRAMRVIRQLTTAVSAAHSAVPYFFLVGPFNIMKRQNALGGAPGERQKVIDETEIDPATGINLKLSPLDNSSAAIERIQNANVPNGSGANTFTTQTFPTYETKSQMMSRPVSSTNILGIGKSVGKPIIQFESNRRGRVPGGRDARGRGAGGRDAGGRG